MRHHLVLRVITKMLMPAILLFALYTQFHGDYGPGGGFQGGVIFAAAFVLHGIVFGVDETRRVLPGGLVRVGTALGILLYTGTGFAGLVGGANFLDYDVLAADKHHAQELGILLIESGVFLTVAFTMLLIFYAFTQRAPHLPDEEW
jgi:multicomponent Na+:H+ antiporter subunit B